MMLMPMLAEADTYKTVNGVVYVLWKDASDNFKPKAYVDRSSKHKDLKGKVVIVDKVDEYEVYKIYREAFEDCTGITSIELPNTIKEIGVEAFLGCSSMEYINIPSDVTVIEGATFYRCSSLKSVELPENLKEIGSGAFAHCSSLISISKSGGVKIPDGITEIPEGCFEGCSSLQSINLPSSVKTIGSLAFYGCTSLATIEKGMRVEKIGVQAFSNSGLKTMTISNSTVEIGSSAFNDCDKLESLIIGSGLTTMGQSAFSSCDNLKAVTIQDGVTEISNSAFIKCINLPEISIPNSVITIGGGAFMDCTSLATVSIGDNVTQIGDYAFYNCKKLPSILIPNSVIDLGEKAFYGCSSLAQVKIGENIEELKEETFYNCETLPRIEIPYKVKTISPDCFSRCNSLKEVRLFPPKIGRWFSSSSITDINIGSTVETVEEHAFDGCNNLERVHFDEHSNLKVIEKYAFYRLNFIKKIILPESVTTIGEEAFQECKAMEVVSLPSTLNSIEKYAFWGCVSLDTIIAYMPIPFVINENVFSSKTYNDAVLWVDKNEDKYRETFAWSKFFHIVKIGNKPGEGDGGKESDNYKKGGGGTVTTRSSQYDITATGMGEVVVDKKTKSSGKGWTSSFSGLNMREEQLTVKIAHYPDSGVPFKFIPDAGYMVKQVQFRPEKNGTLKDVTNAIVFDPTISGYTYKAFDKDTGPKLVVTFEKATNPVLSKTKASIEKGKTLTLKATESSPCKTVTWKSSNTKVATVSSNGKVKGVKAGTATITCTSVATGLSSKCKVTIGYVKLDKTEAFVKKGKTLTLTPTVYPTTLADQSVTWTSSDTNIATVSSAGKVKGIKVGTATITCTSVATGLSTACTVTVGAVTLDKTKAAIKKGKTVTLTAKVYPTTLEDKSVTWTSSDTKIATVSSTGKVKGIKYGTATITCTSVATGLSATCKVTVGTVKLDKKEMVLEKGKTAMLKATLTPTTLEDKNVTWTSSDTKIATVSSTGKVKGIKYGTATITCTSVATGLSATCQVTVGKVVIGVSEVAIKKSRTVTLTATVYPSTLTDRSVTWESSDTRIATVSSGGKVKGIKAGTATITCTSVATGLSSTCTVTVLAASGARSMEGDDDETTGIENLEEVPAATEPFDVYDLSGRKVRSQVTSLKGLPAGIYIVNGKKMIIK